MNSSIEYANAPYADITINTVNAATESILPAAGNYAKSYKATDKFKVEFLPTEKYQFIKWKATPEDSVEFEEATALSTIAKIISAEEPIIIEPVCL